MLHQYLPGHFKLSACLMVLTLAAAGCAPPRATVSGKVTVGGKPVTVGTVLFVGPDNQIATGTLNKEGHYVAPRVPLGKVKVAVQTLQPKQIQAAAKRPKDAPPLPGRLTNLVPLPEKYADPETSGLICDVQQAQQEYDIDLK